eukprot:Hpha_TRINITY_DN30979_c0_g1::TRINITY_DN30979_c0_g1_i1::g.112282::m.112282
MHPSEQLQPPRGVTAAPGRRRRGRPPAGAAVPCAESRVPFPSVPNRTAVLSPPFAASAPPRANPSATPPLPPAAGKHFGARGCWPARPQPAATRHAAPQSPSGDLPHILPAHSPGGPLLTRFGEGPRPPHEAWTLTPGDPDDCRRTTPKARQVVPRTCTGLLGRLVVVPPFVRSAAAAEVAAPAVSRAPGEQAARKTPKAKPGRAVRRTPRATPARAVRRRPWVARARPAEPASSPEAARDHAQAVNTPAVPANNPAVPATSVSPADPTASSSAPPAPLSATVYCGRRRSQVRSPGFVTGSTAALQCLRLGGSIGAPTGSSPPPLSDF